MNYWACRDDISGWFFDFDFLLFDLLLSNQTERSIKGDLLEIGCYLGKSAIVLGLHRGQDETLTVCDLFEQPAGDSANRREQLKSFAGLQRDQFERNFRRFAGSPPKIIQGSSELIRDGVAAETIRFAHVDGSHMYQHARTDLASVKALMRPDGIIACDDYNHPAFPGVGAAVWEAVFTDGMQPLLVSNTKLYGTWGPTSGYRSAVLRWLTLHPEVHAEEQEVLGFTIIRAENPPAPLPVGGPARRPRLAPLQPFVPPIVHTVLQRVYSWQMKRRPR